METAPGNPASRATVRLFIGYVFIAGLATVVDTGILLLLRIRLLSPVWLATAAGYSCGMATNFLLNKYLNFGSFTRPILLQARTFIIVAIIGLAMKSALMEVFVHTLNLRLLIAIALAVIIVWLWNFWGHHTLTFQGGIRSFVARRFARSKTEEADS